METYDAHKTTTEVRQGNRTLDNFWVLVISTVAVVALFVSAGLATLPTSRGAAISRSPSPS